MRRCTRTAVATAVAIATPVCLLSACGGSSDRNDSVPNEAAGRVPTSLACRDFDNYVNGSWKNSGALTDKQTAQRGSMSEMQSRSEDIQIDIARKGGADPHAALIQRVFQAGIDVAAVERAGALPVSGELATIDAIQDREGLLAYLMRPVVEGGSTPIRLERVPGSPESAANAPLVKVRPPALPFASHADPGGLRRPYVMAVAYLFMQTGMSEADAMAHSRAWQTFDQQLAAARRHLPADAQFAHALPQRAAWLSIEDARQVTPGIAWDRYFGNQGLVVPKAFWMEEPLLLQHVDTMLSNVPVDTWKSALKAWLLLDAAPYLTRNFRVAHALAKKLSRNADPKLSALPDPSPPSRDQEVLRVINESPTLGQAMGALFVSRTMTPEVMRGAQVLLDDVRTAFRARLRQTDWLAPETVRRALDKERNMRFRLGQSPGRPDLTGLVLPQPFFEQVRAIQRFDRTRMLSGIGAMPDASAGTYRPQLVNAFYRPDTNTVSVMAAIMLPPFFDPRNDAASNYGGLGAVIGHEITHGFGPEMLRGENLLLPSDWDEYAVRSSRLTAQFNAYQAYPGIGVNGNLTLEENVADLGGLNAAHDALQNRLLQDPAAQQIIDGATPAQRLFLSWARSWRSHHTLEEAAFAISEDTHALGRFRINGPLSNLPAFGLAFSCQPGDRMVRAPADQVRLW